MPAKLEQEAPEIPPAPNGNVYEIHVAKIYGKKYWLTVGGIWFFLNFSLLFDLERLEFNTMEFTNYLYLFLSSILYFVVALFFYTKEFVINKKFVRINYRLGDFVFFQKSYALEDTEEM